MGKVLASRQSAPDLAHLAWAYRFENTLEVGHEARQPVDAARGRIHDDDTHRSAGEQLLIRDTRIYCDEHVEIGGHRVEQIAIIKVLPTAIAHASDVVATNVRGEVDGNAVVEKDAHIA